MLLSHPRHDGLFEQIVGHQIGLVDSGSRSLAAARRAVRRCYADADLYRQSSVLIDGTPTTVWFAYRDGRRSASLPATQWWKGQSIATASLHRGGLSGATPEFRTLLGLPPVAGDRETLAERVGPDVCMELRRLARGLARLGAFGGVVELRLPWGQRRPVEYYAQWKGPDAGDYRLAARSIEDRDDALMKLAVGIALGTASGGQRRRILSEAVRRDLSPGDGIAGSDAHGWAILVVAGIVRLLVRADGQEPTLAYAGHGALLGSHLLPEDYSVPIDVEAVAPSVLLQLSPRSIQELIDANGRFARAVVDQAQVVVGSTALTLAARAAANLPQRLAREILLLAGLYPARGLIPVTEQQLADGIGSIRESVARTLGTFRRNGWIATTSRGLLVLDEGGLRGRAMPETLPPAPLVADATV